MNKEFDLSRRNFLTGALVAGAAAGMGLTGCSPKQTTSEHKDETGGQAASAADDVPAWLGEPPAISDEDCVETIQTEVLVIGAGCSGLVAANFSAMEGAKTLLIEKYEVGTGLRGSAIGAVGSRKQKEAGVDIDPVEICNDLVALFAQ